MDRDRPVRAITSGSRQIVLLSIKKSIGIEIHSMNIFHTKTYRAYKACKYVRGFIPKMKLSTGMFPANQDAYIAPDDTVETSVRAAALLIHCGTPCQGHYSWGIFWGNSPAE